MWRAAALLVAATAAQAAPPVWRIDPQHTHVHFEVRHFDTSTLRGRFDRLGASLAFDREARRGEVSVSIDTASVSTGVPPLDAVLRRADLLGSDASPQAYFVAGRFDFDGDRVVAVPGELTLRGTSRPLTLRALHFACRREAADGRQVCGGDFEAELRRSDFGISFGLPFVADRVRLVIQVEAIRD